MNIAGYVTDHTAMVIGLWSICWFVERNLFINVATYPNSFKLSTSRVLMNKKILLALLLMSFLPFASHAQEANKRKTCHGKFDQEFGPNTGEITRCLTNTHKVKVLYQLNKTCKNQDCKKPYGVGNINNAIYDYEKVHGMKAGVDYEIIVVIHSGGYRLALDNNSRDRHKKQNPFQKDIRNLMQKGVKIYMCMNTARSKGVKTNQIIQGLNFVTSAVTAIPDLQMQGYRYVQP